MPTTATALLDALTDCGVSHLFANLGSDHPAIIESLAEAASSGRRVPRLITCPNEMVALTAAHGYAQLTGEIQAVLVHVDCGTQAMAGAIHNAARARVPVFIFAGKSPLTQAGELPGGRNEFIHWIQDASDQHGIVRGYVKHDYEVRTSANVKQVIYRALQIARSAPAGPVYLTAAREVLDEEAPSERVGPEGYAALAPPTISFGDAEFLSRELLSARRPLIVTSYLGRNPAAVDELVRFCGRAGVGVLESVPSYLNFPANDSLYQGNQGNEPQQNPVLADADVVLLLDVDVPWIPLVNRPSLQAKIYHLDIDPLKERIPLWHFPVVRSFQADCAAALREMNAALDRLHSDNEAVERRRAHYAALHDRMQADLDAAERPRDGVITPEYLTVSVRRACANVDTIFLNEGITNYKPINSHLRTIRAGTRFTSGGSSLGWSGGAAIGMKLARPEKMIVSLTGDGSYLFSQPSTIHWMARRYETPFLQIVYNNGGWKAPKNSTLAVHPRGYAAKAKDIGVGFDPAPDYAGIAAAAGGALARTVRSPEDLAPALEAGLKAVQDERRCGVLDVFLPPL